MLAYSYPAYSCPPLAEDASGSGGAGEAKELLDAAVVKLYNNQRPHMSIGNLTPNQVYQNNIKTEKLWKNYYTKSPTIVNQ